MDPSDPRSFLLFASCPPVSRAATPGADIGELFWLSVGDPSDPANEMHPLWLRLDEQGRAKLKAVLGLPAATPGDADGDGDVDLGDFVILKNNFGR